MNAQTAERLTNSEGMPSLSRFVAFKIGKALDRKDNKRARTRWESFLRIILHLAGFTCLTIAGFTWHPIAGFVVAGLSCFTFSLLTTGGQPEPTDHMGLTDMR